jgi:nitrile hydratase accessory protein
MSNGVMSESVKDALKPLASVDGEAAFDEPWQAEALAIADTLVQNGMFSAGTWSAALGEALRNAEAGGASDDQQTYYQCVVTALESLIAQHSEIDRPAMSAKRDDWKQAYLATPHGQPVKLAASDDS